MIDPLKGRLPLAVHYGDRAGGVLKHSAGD